MIIFYLFYGDFKVVVKSYIMYEIMLDYLKVCNFFCFWIFFLNNLIVNWYIGVKK